MCEGTILQGGLALASAICLWHEDQVPFGIKFSFLGFGVFFFKPNPIVYILAPGSYESGSPIFKSGESLTVMTLFLKKYLKLA